MAFTRTKTRTTTIRLPRSIYDQAKRLVENEKSGTGSKTSLNDLIVTAITAYLRMHERRQIDAAFAGMSEDADYQKEAMLLAEEFGYSDWEALGLGESDLKEEAVHAASPSR